MWVTIRQTACFFFLETRVAHRCGGQAIKKLRLFILLNLNRSEKDGEFDFFCFSSTKLEVAQSSGRILAHSLVDTVTIAWRKETNEAVSLDDFIEPFVNQKKKKGEEIRPWEPFFKVSEA